jgi:DNA-binding ferritin-like protein
MEYSEIVLALVKIQVQFRFMHWQTTSFSQHKAYGEIYESLDGFIDDFVETCMGKHGRPKFSGGYNIEGEDLEEIELGELLNQVEGFLLSFNEIYDQQVDSDLLNIRDEMLSSLNKLRYLLTLN